MSESIIWTCLPNGTKKKDGKDYYSCSAFLSVRLTSNPPGQQTKLSDYPIMQDWTKELLRKKHKFELHFSGGQKIKVELEKDQIIKDLWKKIFKPDTPVRSFEYQDHTNKNIHSYPVSHLNQYVIDRYIEMAAQSGSELPNTWNLIPLVKQISDYDLDQLLKMVGGGPQTFDPSYLDQPGVTIGRIEEWEVIKNARARLDAFKKNVSPNSLNREIYEEISSNKFIPYTPKANPKKDFAQLFEFYEPKPNKKRIMKIDPPDFDFHDMLSLINEYPKLMRALGLVVDFLVPIKNIAQTGLVELWNKLPTDNIFPRTSYDLNPEFRVKEDSTNFIQGGFLKLDSGKYQLSQIDVESGAMKVKNMANKIAQSLLLGNDVSVDEPFPSLRSTGINISVNGFAEHLHSRFKRNKSLEAVKLNNTSYKVNAEDVLTGYRMDIYDDTSGTWFSLYKRQGIYKVNDETITELNNAVDEGFTQASVTEATPDDVNPDGSKTGGTDELYAAENQFAWDGWSNSVQRPGKSVNIDDSVPSDNEDKSKYENPAGYEFQLNPTFKVVPGTLPRLRFGRSYMIKIRAVDLAGNSLGLSTNPGNINATVKLQYDRYEPVASPTTILGNIIKDGESHEVITIRSNGETQQPADFENNWGTGISPLASRYFIPPEVDQMMAEKHGIFDDGIGSNAGSKILQMYNKIAAHDHDPTNTDPKDIVVQNAGEIKIDYIPDPIASGLAIWYGNPKKLMAKIPFYKSSSELLDLNPQKIKIHLVHHGGSFELDQSQVSNSELTFRIPPGTMESVYISSYFNDDVLKFMGLYNRMNAQATPKIKLPVVSTNEIQQWRSYIRLMGRNRTRLKIKSNNQAANIKQTILDGGHWMFTPPREYRLVHATQQPVKEPVITLLQSQRAEGSNDADLLMKFQVHGNSTERVDIIASWKDPVDDPSDARSKDEPIWIDKNQVVKEIKIEYDEVDKTMGLQIGNTPPPQLKSKDIAIHLLSDTKHHLIDYHLVATTRYREYFFNLIAQKGDLFKLTREGDRKQISIKSSVRPSQVKIHEALPLMVWDKQSASQGFRHVRSGGVTRVYLERPWFSSGRGELLGVVCINPSSFQRTPAMMVINQDFSKWVSQWGSDPIHLPVERLSSYPLAKDFYNYADKKEKLTLQEAPGISVDVVGYPVHFDYVKKLWYSDIYVTAPKGQYFTFSRFALARFQPESLAVGDKVDRLGTEMSYDLHLSKIVHADFMQLLPQKVSRLRFTQSGSKQNFKVNLTGPISIKSQSTAGIVAGNHVEVNIEEKVESGAEPIYVIDPAHTFWSAYNAASINNGVGSWSHEFNLPEKYATTPFRVVVKEWEWHYADKDVNPAMALTVGSQSFSMAPRLVFANTFEVN